MTYRDLWRSLLCVYGEGEAHAIADLVLAEAFGLSKTNALCGGVERLPADDAVRLQDVVRRLQDAEPVQYVLGRAGFCGREFLVRQGVLIPRPETAELCRWIVSENSGVERQRVLDIGTGSGCIAITLSLDLSAADVSAWDISPEAVAVARQNAGRLHAPVTIERHDILTAEPDSAAWNIIVSNPPYVCECEKTAMHANVLMHEPPASLFVPDTNPLLFYRAIARYAAVSLRPHGRLYFEINPLYAADTAQLLHEEGFDRIEIKKDEQGKERMISCHSPAFQRMEKIGSQS